jgi:hypothetical protein
MLVEIRAGELTAMLTRLQAVQAQLKEKDISDDEFIEKYSTDLEHWANTFDEICHRLDIDISNSISQLKSKVRTPQNHNIDLWIAWRDFRREIVYGLVKHSLLYISETDKKYYKKEALFGELVYEKFPNARTEIESAGSCHALGLNTACVFHLMRVIEIGGKALLSYMRATKYLPKAKGGLRIKHIDLCTWGEIKNAMQEGLGAQKALLNSSVKRKAIYQFCNDAVESFGCFQNAWRDKVSHSNTVYDEYDAKKIINNTERFMRHLATRIKST